MSYKAVVFDLDGTLLDTLQDIANSVNAVLEYLNYPTHKLAAYRLFLGDGIDNLTTRALPIIHRDQTTVVQTLELINEEYSKHWADNTVPYDGIHKLLDELITRDIKLAVLSNKPHNFTEIMVAKILSRWHFSAVVGTSPSVMKKPSPAAARHILQNIRIPPNEFLYLGDSGVDMQTAVKANMYPVGALWGFRSAEELWDNGAKALIAHPTELISLL